MRALGLDLGSKRIGVATSDRSGTIASPLTTVSRSGSRADEHRRIADIAREVVEFGPINASIHKIDENVGVEELAKLAQVYRGVLERLLHA